MSHRFLSSAVLLGLCAVLLGGAGVASLRDRHGAGTVLGGAGAALRLGVTSLRAHVPLPFASGSHAAASASLRGARQTAVYRPPLEELEIVTAGYPRAFFFRTVVGRGVRTLDQAEFLAAFSQLNGVMGASKNMRNATSLTRENEYLTALKEAYPQQMVSVMLSGQGRNPRGAPLEYAGHWLHFAGTTLTADIGADTVTLPVADTSVFRTGIGRFGNSTDDIALCRVDEQGRPDWSTAEQVRLVSIDQAAGTIQVERGILGTQAAPFPAGSYLAPHGAEGPWGSANAQRAWFPNFATSCPTDPARGNRTYSDVYLEEISRFFQPGGALEAYDGVQFDVLVWRPWSRDARRRHWDVDGDGRGDDLILGGENVYGVGVTAFTERLRQQPEMASRFITGDGHSFRNHRSIHVLNGVESEGFPAVGDLAMLDWSGGVNRMRFWDDSRSHPPPLRYVMFKTGEPDKPTIQVPPSRIRLTLAAGPLLDSVLTYFDEPPPEEGEAVGIWDEIIKGREKEKNWLGQPVGETIDLAENTPDLLGGEGVVLSQEFIDRWSVSPAGGGTIERYHHPQYGWCVRLTPSLPPDSPAAAVVFSYAQGDPAAPAVASGDVVAYVDVWSDDHPGYPARVMSMRLAERAHPDRSRGLVSTWVDQVPFHAMAYWRDAGPTTVQFQFILDRLEGNEPYYFQNLRLHNATPAMVRQFERGVVLANPSMHDYTFDLASLFPGLKFRRLVGSSRQDPVTNNGRPVGDTITLGDRDAIFLVLTSTESKIYLPLATQAQPPAP